MFSPTAELIELMHDKVVKEGYEVEIRRVASVTIPLKEETYAECKSFVSKILDKDVTIEQMTKLGLNFTTLSTLRTINEISNGLGGCIQDLLGSQHICNLLGNIQQSFLEKKETVPIEKFTNQWRIYGCIFNAIVNQYKTGHRIIVFRLEESDRKLLGVVLIQDNSHDKRLQSYTVIKQ